MHVFDNKSLTGYDTTQPVTTQLLTFDFFNDTYGIRNTKGEQETIYYGKNAVFE